MNVITWLLVGLIAGFGASRIVNGTGLGILGNLIVGVLGAFIGGALVEKLELKVPVSGLLGVILVALLGSIVLLLVVRTVKRLTS